MNEDEEIHKIIQSIPDEFRVFENKIQPGLISEYFQLMESIGRENFPKSLAAVGDWDALDTLEQRKEMLAKIAQIGDVESYRKVESIVQSASEDLLDFAHVALMFARMKLEQQLSDEPVAYISSGLGGTHNQLRYYFAVHSDDTISEAQESILVNDLQEIIKQSNSALEEIENFGQFVLFRVLVSMDVAIGPFIEQLTYNCPFIHDEYMVVNTEKPSVDFVNRWIRGEFDEKE